MVKALTVALLFAAGGCTLFSSDPAPTPIADPKALWCAENRPQRPSLAEVDVMDRLRLEALVSHNRKGAAWCSWTQ